MRKRAGEEPVIGYTEYDCRMTINYLKGSVGSALNSNIEASEFNLWGLLRKIKIEILLQIIILIDF